MVYRILRDYRQLIGLYHLRNSMIYFRINVIWTACQKYYLLMILLSLMQYFLTFLPYILPIMFQLCIGSLAGLPDICSRNPFLLG